MNGQGLKAVAFQISSVGPCIALKLSGELLGVTHSMCKNFGEVWPTWTEDMALYWFPGKSRCPTLCNLGVPHPPTQVGDTEIFKNFAHALGDPHKLS